MGRFVRWIGALYRELRRRQVIRVAVVYATTAFVILQLGGILVEPFGLGDRALRLVLFLLVLGFPLAIGLAWVYNLTEEGAVREVEEEVTMEERDPKDTSRRLAWTSNGLIAGLLVVAIGLLLYPRVFSGSESARTQRSPSADAAQAEKRSVAVLPFEALGREKPGPLTEGMHDALLTRLSNISGLKVISRTTVERFRDTDLTLPAIADTLGVRWVLEGGVQKADGQIQVNAQLIDPRTDTHAWADNYRRDLTSRNLFAIQSEITKKIARSMEAHLTPEEKRRVEKEPTKSLQAYQLYVKGRKHLRNVVENTEALVKFRRALQQDSSFALAWAGVAVASARVLERTHEQAPDSLLASPKEAARRALNLDPDLAEAHASLGYVHFLNQNGPAALARLERALKLKPSDAQAHYWMGNLLAVLGQPKKALSHQKRSVNLNPLAPDAQDALAEAYLYNGKYEQALRQARKVREVQEGYRSITEDVALLHLRRGAEVFEGLGVQILEDSPAWLGMRVQAELQEGDTTGARALFERHREESDPWDRAHALAALGEVDAAFEALRAVKWSGVGTYHTANLRYLYPETFGPLRKDPRYQALIREINQQWGLNPDGSVPATNTPIEAQADE